MLHALTPLTPHDPNFNYALWDDEVDSLSIWALPDVSLARDLLRDAYIDLHTLAGVSPPFDHNLTSAMVAALPTATASAPEYWTAPLVLAFEGPTDTDGDPFSEPTVFGITNGSERGPTSRQLRIAVFSETIRDYHESLLSSPAGSVAQPVGRDEIMTNTSAHELLHLFGLIHDGNRTQGGIMCGLLYVDSTEPNRRTVTPEQRKLIRQATEMKIRRVRDVVCP